MNKRNQDIISEDVGEEREYQRPREKVIVEYRDREPKRSGIGCKAIGCILMLLLVACICGSIFVILSKPPFIWNPVVDYLNADLFIPDHYNVNFFDAKNILSQQITLVGENNVALTEAQFTALAQDKLPVIAKPFFDIESDYLRILWVLDDSIPEHPLFGVIEIKQDAENNLYINKIGTGKVGLPDILNNGINSAITKFGGNNPIELINKLISSDENIKVEDIVLQKDQILIKVNVKVNI
jgi:hypothetical protein